jgi:ABC-type uncharacterized transport system ATPase subunit
MIRNYTSDDFHRLEVQPEQEFEKDIWLNTGAFNHVGEKAYTYERDGEVIAIGGAVNKDGINELWSMISKKCNHSDLLILTRFAIILSNNNPEARITTSVSFVKAARWAIILGYELTGVEVCFKKVLGVFRRKQ